MQLVFVKLAIVFGLCCLETKADQHTASPLPKVLKLLKKLKETLVKDGETETKEFHAYSEWCRKKMNNLKYEIKTGEAKKEELQATITKAAADIEAANDKIEDLAGSIASDSKELKEATAVRAKENADFASSEAELVDAIDTLDRAVMVLEKEMKKNPAALAQVNSASNVNNMVKALGTVIDAAAFPVTDQKKLAALAQEQEQGSSDELGEPAYKTHSTNIFDVLEDLKEKAEGQLSDLRKAEASTNHNYELLKQSMDDQIAADEKDLSEEKAAKAGSSEAKSAAEGDLVQTTKTLQNDKNSLASASTTCSTVEADHDATVKSRADELNALKTAQKVLSETSSGAASRSYSFLQVDEQTQVGSSLHSRSDLANAEIITMLKKLAKENHSSALAQLASRIAATLRYGASNGQDPFTKVKQLISDLLSRLEAEAHADVTEKAYCDEETSKTQAKKSELDAEMSKLSTKLDQVQSASTQAKEDVKELQAELAKLASSQAEMQAMRTKTHQEYLQAKADLQLGLDGVRKAVSVLRDYFNSGSAAASAMLQSGDDLQDAMKQPAMPETHAKSGAVGHKIIEELEVVESDFAKELATEEMAEADAQAEYEKMTKTNNLSRTIKLQDVKYKTRESKSLDKTATDVSGDKGTTSAELDAVLEYSSKIKERCVAKPETYETRKARRESEIQGLKTALSILEGEAAFIQRKGKKNGLRGFETM